MVYFWLEKEDEVMKKNNILLLLIVFFVGGILLGMYLFYPNEKKEIPEFEELRVNDPAVTALYEMANPTDSVLSLENVYKKNGFSNEFILGCAFVNYLKSHPNEEVIPEENISFTIHQIFGDITFAHDSGYIVSDYLCAFKYDKGTKSYTYLKGCDGSLNSYLSRTLVSAKKSEDEYILTEKLIYVKSNWDSVIDTEEKEATVSIYSDLNSSHIIDEVSYLWETETEPTINVAEYLDKASTYEYHFVFDGENFVYKDLVKVN